MTPVFSHGALRLYLLSLLAEAPRHGYEVMQALGQRFGGTYSPSAGTIYPRLAKLEEEGLVTKTVDGRRATYAITDAGRTELAGREDELHDLEGEITDSVRRLADGVRGEVRTAMRALRADLAAAERESRATASSTASTPAPPGARPDAAASDAQDGAPSTPADARTAARMAAHDVDLALADFRQQVRHAVRGARDTIAGPAPAVAIRRELDAALERITAALGR